MTRERRLVKNFAIRFDQETSDFLDGQADPAGFVRKALQEAIVKSQAESANKDVRVIAWRVELRALQEELEEIKRGKDEEGRDLSRLTTGATPEEEDIALRVYDAYKGREADLERRIAELKRMILEA